MGRVTNLPQKLGCRPTCLPLLRLHSRYFQSKNLLHLILIIFTALGHPLQGSGRRDITVLQREGYRPADLAAPPRLVVPEERTTALFAHVLLQERTRLGLSHGAMPRSHPTELHQWWKRHPCRGGVDCDSRDPASQQRVKTESLELSKPWDVASKRDWIQVTPSGRR